MEPITREEKFLQKIIDELKNGGGSNSDAIKPINLQDKTITENGTYTADDGYDGLGTVVVEVSGSGDSGGEVDPLVASFIGVIQRDMANPVLPEGLESIGIKAFYNAGFLEKPILPNGLKNIDPEAFYYCTNLALTSLPDGLTTIDTSAFQNCTKLALTKLPDSLTTLSAYAFYGCVSLALEAIPDGVKKLLNSTFYGCTGIKKLSLPGEIEDSSTAFDGCTGLTEVTFRGKPKSIYALNRSIFNNCPNLTVINVPWSEGEFANAPWGATNATINYNYTGE